jgi:hypothetical protein
MDKLNSVKPTITRGPRLTKKQKLLIEHGFHIENEKNFKFERKDNKFTITIHGLDEKRFLELAHEFFAKDRALDFPEPSFTKFPDPKDGRPARRKRVKAVKAPEVVSAAKAARNSVQDFDIDYDDDIDSS